MRTYYEILEVTQSASPEVIVSSYRALAKKYHPDKNPNDSDASNKMAELNEAYQHLSDPAMRTRYDQHLASPNMASNSTNGDELSVQPTNPSSDKPKENVQVISPVWMGIIGVALIVIVLAIVQYSSYLNELEEERKYSEFRADMDRTAEQTRAAKQKRENILYSAGTLLHGTRGASQNYQMALEQYRKLINDFPEYIEASVAAERIGMIYTQGWGVPIDYKVAASWFQRAVGCHDRENHGYLSYIPSAAYMLGEFYENGGGVEKNLEMAYHFYNIAAKDCLGSSWGVEECNELSGLAKKKKKKVSARLSMESITRAQQRTYSCENQKAN